jgi:biotin carboxyl carrier protein
MEYELDVEGVARCLNIRRAGRRFIVRLDDREHLVDVVRIDGQSLSLLVGPVESGADPASPTTPLRSYEVTLVPDAASGRTQVRVDGTPVWVGLNGGRRRRGATDKTGSAGPQRLVAPMPGKIVRVLVKPGDAVAPRQPLIVVEAMKMENELRAVAAGLVAELHAREGQSVEAGALLAVVAPQ